MPDDVFLFVKNLSVVKVAFGRDRESCKCLNARLSKAPDQRQNLFVVEGSVGYSLVSDAIESFIRSNDATQFQKLEFPFLILYSQTASALTKSNEKKSFTGKL